MTDKRKGQTKLSMSNLDAAASGDEIHHLCVGMSFLSFSSVSEPDVKESFEMRLVDGNDRRKQGAHFRYMATPALDEYASTASAREQQPTFLCRRENDLVSESLPTSGTSCTHTIPSPVIGSCVVKVSPFASINGFRCHLASMDVNSSSFRKQKLNKSRFAEELTVKLKQHILVNVSQVAHDRVIAFGFSSMVEESSCFTYQSCACAKCGGDDSLLSRAVMSGESSDNQLGIDGYVLYVELYAGNMVLVDSRGRISSALYAKSFDKSGDDPRRREVGMMYYPYYHNNVSNDALRSIANVVQCASLMSSSLLYDAGVTAPKPPMRFELALESPLRPLPTISARFAIEMFRERKHWNSFCAIGLRSLQELRDALPKRKGELKNDFKASIRLLTACLHSQLSLLDIEPKGNLFSENFTSVFSSVIPPDSLLGECLTEIRRAAPSFWAKHASAALATKQQNRCFTFTTTIQNTNSVCDFYLKERKTPDQQDHVSHAVSHFSKTLSEFLDQFQCKVGQSSVVPLTKVLVAFILGIPVISFYEGGCESTASASQECGKSDPRLFDFTKTATSGDTVFEVLKRCLSQFDNMGPVLATHCLVSAWDDSRSSKVSFQKSCLSAASSLVKHYGVANDVSSFLEEPIPCPSSDIVKSAPPETQLAFFAIQQSIHEVVEEATTEIPKTHQGRADLAPNSILRALASTRLQQRLLHTVKPSADVFSERINADASEDADIARAEEGSEIANALLAPNLRSSDVGSTRLTTKRCVEALFEAIPTLPPIDFLTESLCSFVISQMLAPYVADTCVALHHPLRQNGNTFVQPDGDGGWAWVGRSYSPLAAGGVTFFGERTIEKGPSTFVSEEIQKLKRMMASDGSNTCPSEEERESLHDDVDSVWSELDTPGTDLGVGPDVVLAYADLDETDDLVTDAIEAEGSPTFDKSSSRRGVSFSPSTAPDCDARYPTRIERKRRKDMEAREAEYKRIRVFTEQHVVVNPFAVADASDDESFYASPAVKRKGTSRADAVIQPNPTSSYEYYYPALRALSDVSVVIAENVNRYRQSRQRAKEKYEELGRRIESSKAYVAAACSKPFLFKALGYGKGFGKSSLRNKGESEAGEDEPESSVTLTHSAGVSDILQQRLNELDRKKSVVLSRASRLYILPPVPPVGDNSPLRPPSSVSATLPTVMRVGPPPTPSTLSPQLRPASSDCLMVPLLESTSDRDSMPQWPLRSFLSSILSRGTVLSLESIRSAQRDFFDFSGVGRSLEYFYAAAQSSIPKKAQAESPNAQLGEVMILSAAQDSEMLSKVFSPKSAKGKLKASDMVENTLKKHEERKSNLENTAKGYHINGNTLIAFADVVNAVLGMVASLVSQGSTWSAIETTFQDRRKQILEEVAAAERRMMAERGYEGRVEDYYERKYEWENEQQNQRSSSDAHSKSKLARAPSDDDNIYSDEDEEFPEEMPTENEELDLVYFFEHQDELDPLPSTKEQLIERLFGPENQWLFRVVTSLNLAESSVTVSLPKVLEDDVPLERDPEMIDIEVTFTDTAYANANAIFKRKKDVDVKVSKAHQADDLVREGAKRRALQKQQQLEGTKSKAKKSKGDTAKQKLSFRDDLLYQEAQHALKHLPQTAKAGSGKQTYVAIPQFKLKSMGKNAMKPFMSSNSFSTMSRSRSLVSGSVGGKVFDSILFQKDGRSVVPEIDHVKGVRVLADSQDPLGDFDCKSFWFLSSPSKVEAIPCDPSIAGLRATLLTSFLILHPRDVMGAVKLLNDELCPHDLVVFSDDPQAEGALPIVIKSRTATVHFNGVPVACRLSFSAAAIEQASCMLFARSRMWSRRCTGRAFWCYGAQLVVRTKEDNASRSGGSSFVPPLVLQTGIRVRSGAPTDPAVVKVNVDTDTGSYSLPIQLRAADGQNRPEMNPSLHSVCFSCYFFDVVRGDVVSIPPSTQPLQLGLGLMFKERFEADFTRASAEHDEFLPELEDSQCSAADLYAELVRSPIEASYGVTGESRAADNVRQRARSYLWKRQKDVRFLQQSQSSTLTYGGANEVDRRSLCVPPFCDSMLSGWLAESPPERQSRTARPSPSPQNTMKPSTPSSALPSPSVAKTSEESEVFSKITSDLKQLVTGNTDASVGAIFKNMRSHSELGLQQLLLYFVVQRKSKSLTSEEKSREAQRKKDTTAKSAKSGKEKQQDKSERGNKGSQKSKKGNQDEDDVQQVKVAPKTDIEIVSLATGMSKTYVENLEKEVKRCVKQKESDLREDEFSETDSDEEEISAKGRPSRRGAVKGRSLRHAGLRMLIADEILRQPKEPPPTKERQTPHTSTQSLKSVSSNSRIDTSRDIYFCSPNSRLPDCWDKELRWLTGRPQHIFAIPEDEGRFGVQRSSLEYCIPVIAPIQSFSYRGSEEETVCFKYVVELQPAGQEKASSRASGAKKDTSAASKKGTTSNFKTIFDSFVRRVGACVTTSYRNDYWACFLQGSHILSSPSSDHREDVDSETVTREQLLSLGSLARDYMRLEQTSLISNEIEAALLERIAPNSTKYFQRVWEVSTSVSEMVDHRLRAVVSNPTHTFSKDSVYSTREDMAIADLLQGSVEVAEIDVNFFSRTEVGRIDFNSAIVGAESKTCTAFGKPNEARLFNI